MGIIENPSIFFENWCDFNFFILKLLFNLWVTLILFFLLLSPFISGLTHFTESTNGFIENKNKIIELEDKNKKLLDKLNLLENGLNNENIEQSTPIEENNTLIQFSPKAIKNDNPDSLNKNLKIFANEFKIKNN